MKNEKICKMLDILEKRTNKIRSDLLTELKSEKNFELAVKIFEISDELCFKKIENIMKLPDNKHDEQLPNV